MSLETQVILHGHLKVEDVCAMLHNDSRVTRAIARAMHKADYKIVEVATQTGDTVALNVFLASYAASDYQDVYLGDSTFITGDYAPSTYAMLLSLAEAYGGFIRRIGGEPWQHLTAPCDAGV